MDGGKGGWRKKGQSRSYELTNCIANKKRREGGNGGEYLGVERRQGEGDEQRIMEDSRKQSGKEGIIHGY